MRIVPVQPLTCPHDGSVLQARGNTLACAQGHSFDRAREGYFNLLPVQDKASLDPGDSKDMVAARQRFLNTGAFQAIADAVSTEVLSLIDNQTRSFTLLDAGCGEGYYMQSLANALASHHSNTIVHCAGIDISKWAVRAAAKRAVPVAWVVASNRRPPVLPESTDLIICLFGFPIWPGFAAIQPIGGHVLLVDPGPDHLLELRQIIYPEVRRNERGPQADTQGYARIATTPVTAHAHIASQATIADLLSMTPHAHRATASGRAALAARDTLDITIDVSLRVFRRIQT